MDKFTVEEINLMCVFAGQVTGKLEAMSDEEFA